MSDIPPIPEGILEDLAIILTPQERQAIMDARLIVWMVQHGQTAEAVALADAKSPAHFFDTLDGLADRLENAERVGRRKMREWVRSIREGDE